MNAEKILRSLFGDFELSDLLAGNHERHSKSFYLRNAVAVLERELITGALVSCNTKMDDTAEVLGIGRRTLNEKIVKLGLVKPISQLCGKLQICSCGSCNLTH